MSYAGAETGDEGMALKIRTRAEDMPDGRESFYLRPSRFKNGSILGSEPRNRRYRVIGSSVPPFSRIFFRNAVAVSLSKRLVSLKA